MVMTMLAIQSEQHQNPTRTRHVIVLLLNVHGLVYDVIIRVRVALFFLICVGTFDSYGLVNIIVNIEGCQHCRTQEIL